MCFADFMSNTCAQCHSPLAGVSVVCPRCGFVNPVAKKRMSTIAVVAIVLLVLMVPTLGIFGVLGVYGVRKYIANAKIAEARNTLAQIAKDAAEAYEGANAGTLNATRRLCPSASAPVPANDRLVSGRKHQSMPGEWHADEARNAGFACLKFEMMGPQYFQYGYEATATGFVVTAHGDLDGDGVFSTFQLKGQVVGDRLVIAPAILEVEPEE